MTALIAQNSLPFAQIVLGSGLMALGCTSFGADGAFERLEAQLLWQLSEEQLTRLRQASATVMVVCGLAICIAALFGRLG